MKVQLLGLCRWSYLCPGGFQIAHDDMDERRRYLYNHGRLRRRWFWFRHVVVPGLLAQTDPDFTVVVMTGPDLPEPFMSRLRDLTARIPQFRLELVEPMKKHREACLRAVAPHIDPAADAVAHFRQDDDDAVAVDFVERVRADAQLVEPAFRREGRAFLDYGKGLTVMASESGIRSEARYIMFATAALTHFCRPDDPVTALHFTHFRVPTLMPGVSISDRLMYLRLLHHDNDAGSVGAGYETPLGPRADIARLARERFRVDLDQLDAAARRFGKPRGGARVGPARPERR